MTGDVLSSSAPASGKRSAPGPDTASGDAGPGRPRSVERHEAVLAATRSLLAEEGYSALTFSAVARRAQVTRQLVNRWWPLKASLVSEALFGSGVEPWPTTYVGDLRADLRTFIGAIVVYGSRPDVRAGVAGLTADADADTPLPGLVEGFLVPLHDSLLALLEANDTRESIDVPLTLNTIRGAVVMHLIADRTPPDVVVSHLTDTMFWALRNPAGERSG